MTIRSITTILMFFVSSTALAYDDSQGKPLCVVDKIIVESESTGYIRIYNVDQVSIVIRKSETTCIEKGPQIVSGFLLSQKHIEFLLSLNPEADDAVNSFVISSSDGHEVTLPYAKKSLLDMWLRAKGKHKQIKQLGPDSPEAMFIQSVDERRQRAIRLEVQSVMSEEVFFPN